MWFLFRVSNVLKIIQRTNVNTVSIYGSITYTRTEAKSFQVSLINNFDLPSGTKN